MQETSPQALHPSRNETSVAHSNSTPLAPFLEKALWFRQRRRLLGVLAGVGGATLLVPSAVRAQAEHLARTNSTALSLESKHDATTTKDAALPSFMQVELGSESLVIPAEWLQTFAAHLQRTHLAERIKRVVVVPSNDPRLMTTIDMGYSQISGQAGAMTLYEDGLQNPPSILLPNNTIGDYESFVYRSYHEAGHVLFDSQMGNSSFTNPYQKATKARIAKEGNMFDPYDARHPTTNYTLSILQNRWGVLGTAAWGNMMKELLGEPTNTLEQRLWFSKNEVDMLSKQWSRGKDGDSLWYQAITWWKKQRSKTEYSPDFNIETLGRFLQSKYEQNPTAFAQCGEELNATLVNIAQDTEGLITKELFSDMYALYVAAPNIAEEFFPEAVRLIRDLSGSLLAAPGS